MGRPKVKIIDDSAPVEETKILKKRAKSESKEVISAVERTPKADETTFVQGAKQTDSERLGRASGTSRPDERATQTKPQKPGKAKPRSKKYKEVVEQLDKSKTYPVNEALDLVKKLSYTKFPSSLEAHINTAQPGIRGLVSLPYATGRKLRILAFGAKDPQVEGVIFGSEENIEEINKGKVDFDLVITAPAWMPKLAKVARILGPRGLMPNPKNGTISDDLKKSAEGFLGGKTEYKTEAKAPVMHVTLGKVSQPNEELAANIKALIQTVGKTKVKKITLSPTMGPGVRLDLGSL